MLRGEKGKAKTTTVQQHPPCSVTQDGEAANYAVRSLE